MLKNRKSCDVALIGGLDEQGRCGVADYSICLIRAFPDSDFLIHPVILQETANLDGIDVTNAIRIESYNEVKALWKAAEAFRREAVSVVQIEHPFAACSNQLAMSLLPLFCKMKGMKVVTTIHEYSTYKWRGRLRIKLLFGFFSNFVFVVEPSFLKTLGKPKFLRKKMKYVPISSSIPSSKPSSDLMKTIKSKLKCQDEKIMAYFGFVQEHKCFQEILDAMIVLKNEGNLKTKLLVIGSIPNDIEYRRTVLKTISTSLRDYVYITGYLEPHEVSTCFALSDFAILLFKEGVSVRNSSFLAAYQSGLDIIASAPSSSSFPYDDVRFVKAPDIDLIAEAIKAMQSTENSLSHEDIAASRRITTWDEVCQLHADVYRRLFGMGRSRQVEGC